MIYWMGFLRLFQRLMNVRIYLSVRGVIRVANMCLTGWAVASQSNTLMFEAARYTLRL